MKLVLLCLGLLVPACGSSTKLETAVFAGGCFWCMTPPFMDTAGVVDASAGYTGGQGKDPTYEDYAARGFVEAVRVAFDPSRVSYARLLDVYWRQIDPGDPKGQFSDRGPQYRPVIYYADEGQRRLAEASRRRWAESGRFGRPIAVEILPASPFYLAEEMHQDYKGKNPLRYLLYRRGSGRERFLEGLWGRKPPKETPMKSASGKDLTPMQVRVALKCETEPPFRNEYWDNHREGIYVDVISGKPLFSSIDKFDSGTGWPSFTRPLEPVNVEERLDRSLSVERTEVRGAHAGSHLGHVFPDGPAPTGRRYCINSASLRFIPREELEKAGYGRYEELFKKK